MVTLANEDAALAGGHVSDAAARGRLHDRPVRACTGGLASGKFPELLHRPQTVSRAYFRGLPQALSHHATVPACPAVQERYLVEQLGAPGFYHVIARYGYTQRVQQVRMRRRPRRGLMLEHHSQGVPARPQVLRSVGVAC